MPRNIPIGARWSGYQPAQKWLKDRRGCTLGFDDVKHYGRIIYVLRGTARMMDEIDKLYKTAFGGHKTDSS